MLIAFLDLSFAIPFHVHLLSPLTFDSFFIYQVIYGLVGDQDWNLTVIYGISCIGSGLAVLLLPTAKSYWLMSVLCGLFGFFVSANYSLMTVMLVGYLGLEKLAHAYGLIMMIQGLANLGGPPMAGNLCSNRRK